MKFLLLLACLVLPLAAGESAPRPLLSPVFGEHMVLQRDQPAHVWGWAEPGTEVTVDFADQTKTATTDSDGRWQINLDPLPASSIPRPLSITAKNRESKIETQKCPDVLVGDVWVCGGQSNMEFALDRARGGAEAVAQAAHDAIRLFRVASQPAYASADTLSGAAWRRCEPAAFAQPGGFSAVAYYFARKVHAETGVPIGLIQVAVGGTPAESWMSPAALTGLPEFAAGLTEIDRLRARGAPVYGNFIMHWYDEFDRGLAARWSEPALDDTAWKSVSLDNAFAELGVPATPSVVWLRREITMPDRLPPGPAKLLLGVVEKMDTAWLNGRWVGASAWVENPRAYTLPPDALRAGKNQLTLRVLKTAPDGGFRSPPASLRLVLGDGTAIPLANDWRAALSVDARPPHPLPLGYENWPTMPAVLHYGMLHPLAGLRVAGALWYQGEANFTRAAQYRALLPALIADWRALFGSPAMPFYVVQLPAFMARRNQPGTDAWTDLRAAQAATTHTVPHTGLAVTIDTGDANDIHPTDKLPVGERLARLALHDYYQRADIGSAGPRLVRFETTNVAGELRLRFNQVEGGLVVHGERLGEFSIAGEDRVWHWAEARLDGSTVIVASAAVTHPVAVRYAWQANPLATLFNGDGLPAEPFRTDEW